MVTNRTNQNQSNNADSTSKDSSSTSKGDQSSSDGPPKMPNLQFDTNQDDATTSSRAGSVPTHLSRRVGGGGVDEMSAITEESKMEEGAEPGNERIRQPGLKVMAGSYAGSNSVGLMMPSLGEEDLELGTPPTSPKPETGVVGGGDPAAATPSTHNSSPVTNRNGNRSDDPAIQRDESTNEDLRDILDTVRTLPGTLSHLQRTTRVSIAFNAIVCFALLVLIGLVAFIFVNVFPDGTGKSPSDPYMDVPSSAPTPPVDGSITLNRIMKRKKLICGVPLEQKGFAFTGESGELEGFDVDLVSEDVSVLFGLLRK